MRGKAPSKFGQSKQEVSSNSQINQLDAKRDTLSTPNLSRINEATSKRQSLEPHDTDNVEGKATGQA